MIDAPKTFREAASRRYGAWAGNPKGRAYMASQCAYSVYPNERFAIPKQCTRKPGHGPDALYCAQHAKSVTP